MRTDGSRRRRTATIGTLAATSVLTVGFAGPAPADQKPNKLVVTEKVTGITEVDNGAAGPSQGDRLVLFLDVFSKKGRKVGVDGADCVVMAVRADGTVYDCTSMYRLKRGDIIVQGLVDIAKKPNSVVIIGGTGRYLGVTGRSDFTQPTEDTFVSTFFFD